MLIFVVDIITCIYVCMIEGMNHSRPFLNIYTFSCGSIPKQNELWKLTFFSANLYFFQFLHKSVRAKKSEIADSTNVYMLIKSL